MFFENQTSDAVLSIALEGERATATLLKRSKEVLEISSFLEAPIEDVKLLYTSEQKKTRMNPGLQLQKKFSN